jgi:simple sugar transport system substrate-binding protein/ribose transport system substrate-binding protein
VAPFVTKDAATLTLGSPVDGLPGSLTTTAVTDNTLWGNVYGSAHGGVCASS